jgi:adenylate kinase family enzyme
MRVLTASDPLPLHLRRFAVAGTAGAGKSTLARALSSRLGVPFVQMEDFYWGPSWTVRPTWRSELLDYVSGDAWAIEWQGEEVREEMTARTQVLVWLDHPRWFCMARVVFRTLRRRVSRPVLAGDNVEGRLREFFTDPDHVVKLSWRRWPVLRARVRQVISEDRHQHLLVVRLRGQRQVDRWLRGPFAHAVR